MTEAAAEATDRPPEKNATDRPPEKKKWHAATWIALASAVTAIAAAGISFNQVNIAAEQNTVAEQTQLIALTTTITSQLAQGQTSGNQPAANSLEQVTGKANAVQAVVAELSAEGQAAAVLINSLHGNGVAGIEYVQAARALQAGGETAQAITFYKAAIAVSPGDVGTRGDAWRFMAALYYSLGQNVIGHRDMMTAARIFRGHVELTHTLKEESIAQAYLGDAYYQLLNDSCHLAITDLEAALQAVKASGLKTSSADPTLFALVDQDSAAAHTKCIK
jgi:tetratricopeptide (TPR) repeat protein